MGWIIGKGIGVPFRMGGGQSWSTYWSHQSEVLFFGLYSEISGGQMPNKVDGGATYLTVAGSAGSETYQCPNTAAYIAADTDYIWFKSDASQRTITTAELIGYDLQRTPVKYNDTTPNAIVAIMILKAGETISGTKRDRLFKDMWLPVLWDNNLNAYGHIKSNRTGQKLWGTPINTEIATYITGLTTPLSYDHIANLDTFVSALKAGLLINDLDDAFDAMYVLAGETEESSLRNIVKNAHYSHSVNSCGWTQYEGFLSNGTSSYIRTNYTPKTQGVKYVQNNASFGHCSVTDTDTDGFDFGINDGTYSAESCRSSNNWLFRLNADASTHSTASLNGAGIFICCRSIYEVETPYINGVAGTAATEVSRTIPALEMYLCCRNASGSPEKYSDRKLAFVFFGRDFTQDEVTVITNSIEAYMDANGKGVIA